MKHHDMHPATKRLRNQKMVSIALFVTSSQAPNHQLIKVQKCGISFLSFPHTHTHTIFNSWGRGFEPWMYPLETTGGTTMPTKRLLATIQC